MKTSVTFLLLFFLAIGLHAQAPQAFDFQGVARNATGEVIGNTKISLRLTIRPSTALGPIVYQEKHEPTTSPSGIFTVSCGKGAVSNGVFENINWKAESKLFLQVEIDAAGGSNYTNLGATQIMSVPYALHSAKATESEYALEAARWKNDDPVVQTGNSGSGGIMPTIKSGSALLWYPRKSSFRVGENVNTIWEDSNIGSNSVTFGLDNIASGAFTFAAGANNLASGNTSIALGQSNTSSGLNSIAVGGLVESEGWYSVALGYRLSAKTHYSSVFGAFNDRSDVPESVLPAPEDRIFQIGNGHAPAFYSNAVTILRNGNFGIGSTVLEPTHILDIGGRPRIRHNPASANGVSAGIHLDVSNGKPAGFVGMKSDNEIGFYNAAKWLFWMDDIGNAHITGSNYNTSDRRLKRNFTSLSSSLSKLTDLNGYHYFWKDSTLDQTLQTGLIAQEVETHFPDLVKTDDKGFKSVNYTGLIPHLIESVKELKASVEYLQNLNKDIKAQNETLKAQASEIEDLRKEFTTLLNAAKNSRENASANLQPDHTSFQPNRSDK